MREHFEQIDDSALSLVDRIALFIKGALDGLSSDDTPDLSPFGYNVQLYVDDLEELTAPRQVNAFLSRLSAQFMGDALSSIEQRDLGPGFSKF